MVTVAVELTRLLVIAVCNADENPNEDDSAPAGETMVPLEEATANASIDCRSGLHKGLTCGGEHESME